MPLCKRARIEIYLPAAAGYAHLQNLFEREFLYTFGGCTSIRGIKGNYRAANGTRESEAINLIYADTPFDVSGNFSELSHYTDRLKAIALEITDEESILIVVHEIYHSV